MKPPMPDQYLIPFPLITATQAVQIETWHVDAGSYPFEPPTQLDAGDQVFGTSDGCLLGIYRDGLLVATYAYDAERQALVLQENQP